LKLLKFGMKKVLVILVLLLVADLVSSQASAPTIAIAEIVKNFYRNQSIDFDFLVHHSSHFNKISSMVDMPVRIEAINISKELYLFDQSAILIFNETQSYLGYCGKIFFLEKTTRQFHFLVYIENLKEGDLERLAVYNFYLRGSNNFNFLIDFKSEHFIKLVTFEAFHQPNCRQFQPLTINQFSKAKKRWETQKFSIKRFRNFNGCELLTGDMLVFQSPLYEKIHEMVASSLNFKSRIWDILCR
jgi:hypothetical protein